LNQYAGLKADPTKVYKCTGAQNDTVADCPVAATPGKEFIVAVQNSQIRQRNGLVTILLPNNNYTA